MSKEKGHCLLGFENEQGKGPLLIGLRKCEQGEAVTVKYRDDRYRAMLNEFLFIKIEEDPKRVTVCCGFWSSGIIGPFFFENRQEEAVTVNGDRYRNMLNEFFFTKN